jgi:hypothetical protein
MPCLSQREGEIRAMNKGVKRLAVLLGGLGALAGLIYIAANITESLSFGVCVFLAAFAAVCFFIPFGLVHAIAWVVRGFKQ